MAPPSSCVSAGTTTTGPVSMTPHVKVRPNDSPTRTDVRSVFHQQRIGSDSTWPARGAGRGAAGLATGLAGAFAAGAAAVPGATGACPASEDTNAAPTST